MANTAIAEIGAEDTDAVSDANDWRARAQCERLRQQIESKLRSAVNGETVLTERDVKDYMQMNSEAAYKAGGAATYAEQAQWLKDHVRDGGYVSKMIGEAKIFRARLKDAVSAAKSKGALTETNVAHLEQKITKRSGNWNDVKAFFENDGTNGDSLKGWIKNWNAIAQKTKEVKDLCAKHKLKASDLPELAKLEASQKSGSVLGRLQLLDTAIAAISMREHSKTSLYKKAMAVMRPAVSSGAMTETQAKRNMSRIYAKYKGDKLEDYIQNILPGRVDQWMKDIAAFRTHKNRCDKLGVETVSESTFFGMEYNERRTEIMTMVSEAKKAGEPKAGPMLADVERKMETKEWDVAKKRLRDVENMQLTTDERARVGHMRHRLEERIAGEKKRDEKENAENPGEELCRDYRTMRQMMMIFGTPSIRRMYAAIRHRGGADETNRLYVLNKGLGNVKWGVDHNWVNKETHRHLRENRQIDTEFIHENGHRARGTENIDLSVQSGAKQKDTTHRQYEKGHRGVTFYWFDKHDTNKVMDDINERKGNFLHNYWTDYMPEDATLEQVINFVQFVIPHVKKYMNTHNRLRAAGHDVDKILAGEAALD